MTKIKAGDKVYLKYDKIVATVIEVIEEEKEHPHNGDVYKIITTISAKVNGNDFINYLPINSIMTKEDVVYKIKSLEVELNDLENAFIKMI